MRYNVKKSVLLNVYLLLQYMGSEQKFTVTMPKQLPRSDEFVLHFIVNNAQFDWLLEFYRQIGTVKFGQIGFVWAVLLQRV